MVFRLGSEGPSCHHAPSLTVPLFRVPPLAPACPPLLPLSLLCVCASRSSLALVFALHHYKPAPLYVMDEIDAALDFKNVSIVANYIKERTKDAQFVIISLRNNMFELASRLVGIYKTDNSTKSITIDPGSFTVGRPAEEEAAEPPVAGVVPAAALVEASRAVVAA